MDFTIIIGFAIGLGMILLAQTMEGGNVASLMQLTAGMIVIGGTIGAVIGSFPVPDLMNAMNSVMGRLMAGQKAQPKKIIEEILGFAMKARKEGVIVLEKEAQKASDPLMKIGLEAVSDGADPTLVRELMETQLSQIEENISTAVKVWEAAGAYSPTFGIIGAVMGLIQVMQHLSDPSKLGAGIAVAFVATVYGLVTANLIYIPISTKIKFKSREELLTKQIMIEGILSIQAGESPALIERKLNAFLLESSAASAKGQTKEATA